MPLPPDAKLLIGRLSAHGDVLQTLPLLAALKAACPTVRVGWLVEESAAPLLVGHPLIDRLHIVRRKSWLAALARRPWQLPRVGAQACGLVRELREAGYHASLDVQGLLKSAIWPVLAGIPQRWGYAGVREQAWRLYTHRLGVYSLREADRPVVFQFLEFLTALGVPVPLANEAAREALRFPLTPLSAQVQADAASLLAGFPSDRPLLALAPATMWASKCWPSTHWQALLDAVSAWPVSLVLLGAPGDAVANDTLLASLPDNNRRFVRNLAGQTDWPVLTALLSRCAVLVGPDSAPLHLAQALASLNVQRQPRIVGLYGPTSPGRTGPVQRAHTVCVAPVACRPCFERVCPLTEPLAHGACMREVSVQTVLSAMAAQLRALGWEAMAHAAD